MKRTTLCAVLFASFPGIQTYAQPVTADTADPIGVKCEMRRVCIEMASKDDKTTLAVEMRVGRYFTERNRDWVRENCARIRGNCARMPPSARYRYPECLVIEEFDARRAGDVTARAMLYEEGYNREKTRSRFMESPQEMREGLSPFDSLHLTVKHAWDSYLIVGCAMVGPEKGFPWPGVHLKKVGNRYWLTEESGERNLSSISHQARAPYLRDDATILPQPPMDMVRLKLSLNRDSPVEKRQLSIETLQDDVAEDSTALVLYIRPILESADAPLLRTDSQVLDRPSAALKSSLALYNDEAATIHELVHLWAPEVRENVESNLRMLQDAKFPLNNGFFGQQIDKVRLVARVETDDGIVWYVRYPSMKLDLKAEVGQGRTTWEAAFRTLIQRKINGEYKLAQRLEDSAVSEILTDKDVVSFISRMSASQP